jgi:hypothetical protein
MSCHKAILNKTWGICKWINNQYNMICKKYVTGVVVHACNPIYSAVGSKEMQIQGHSREN